MRSLSIVVGLLLLVALAGCDTTQPLQLGAEDAQIAFSVTGVTVKTYDVLDVYEDSDLDGQPDDVNNDGVPDVFVWCQESGTTTPSSAPWFFAVRIRSLADGSVQQVDVTSPAAAAANGNLSGYDEAVGASGLSIPVTTVNHQFGVCKTSVGSLSPVICDPAEPPVTVPELSYCEKLGVGVSCQISGRCADNGAPCLLPSQCPGSVCDFPVFVDRRFVFENPRLLSAANRDVLSAASNIVEILSPSTAALIHPSAGICPGTDLGEPNVDGAPQPFTLSLSPGTLVSVEARLDDTAPAGLDPTSPNPTLQVSVTRDGVPIETEGTNSAGITGAIDLTFAAR